MAKYLVVSRFNSHNEDKTYVNNNDVLGFTVVDVETNKIYICKKKQAESLLKQHQFINMHIDEYGRVYTDTLRRELTDFPVKSPKDKTVLYPQYNFPTIYSNGPDGTLSAYDADGMVLKLSPYNYLRERRAFTNAKIVGNKTLIGDFEVSKLNTKSPVMILFSEFGKPLEHLKTLCK